MDSKNQTKKPFSWVTCCAGMAEEPIAEIVKAVEEVVEKTGVSDVTVQDILEKIKEEIKPSSDDAKVTPAEETTAPQTPLTTSV